MTYLDIALLIPLLWGAFKGFRKGFIIEVASLVAFVGAIYLGIKFTDQVALYIQEELSWDNPYLPIVAFTTIFIGVIFGVHFLAKLLEKAIKLVALGLVNRIAGAVFGAMKYFLILTVLIYLLEMLNPLLNLITPEQKKQSLLYAPMQQAAEGIFPLMQSIEEIEVEMMEDVIPEAATNTPE